MSLFNNSSVQHTLFSSHSLQGHLKLPAITQQRSITPKNRHRERQVQAPATTSLTPASQPGLIIVRYGGKRGSVLYQDRERACVTSCTDEYKIISHSLASRFSEPESCSQLFLHQPSSTQLLEEDIWMQSHGYCKMSPPNAQQKTVAQCPRPTTLSVDKNNLSIVE